MHCVVSARLFILVASVAACSSGLAEPIARRGDAGVAEAPSPATPGGAASAEDSSRSPAPPRVEHRSARGVELTELFTHEADTSAPIVVVLHGQNGSPDDLLPLYGGFPTRARIILPRASIVGAGGYGYSWFDYLAGMTEAEFAAIVDEAQQHVADALDEVAPGRRMLFSGYSQGGFVMYALAVRQASRAAYAFPVAASAAWLLLPKPGAPAAPILAFHGTADSVVAIDEARGTVASFREAGDLAELREYPGVGHEPSPTMQADLIAAMVERLAP